MDWGLTTGSFTTGNTDVGLSYNGSYSQLFAFENGTIECDGFYDPVNYPAGSFTITSRDGKAFVFNSLDWDDKVYGPKIEGTGPEPFTVYVTSGSNGTHSPSGGSKLVTSVTISSADMSGLMDDVSVELDVPGAAVYGNSNLITNGDSSSSGTDGTDLGTTAAGTPVTQSFSLENIGDATLTVSGSVSVTGTGFSITQQPSSSIAAGGDSTFTVQFNPTVAGAVTGTVTITNNSEASPYTFDVTATGEGDATKPDVTINQAGGQVDPTNGSPVNFTVVFNEAVTGFATGDVTLAGTAGATTGIVTGSGTTYNVAVSGMAGDGTVIAAIAAGVAQDAFSNTNNASTSTDNVVTYDTTDPDVAIDQAGGQVDPATASPVVFTAVFDEPIDEATFTDVDVTIGGTATTGAVTITEIAPNDDTTFSISVVMTGDGTVTADIGVGVVEDFAGNTNTASTSTDNTVTYDGNKPSVTIDQAAGQADPTNAFPVTYTMVFSEPINSGTLTIGDVAVGGSYLAAGANNISEIAPHDGTTFSVEVVQIIPITPSGTLIVTIIPGRVEDLVGNTNNASTSTDNSVTVDTDAPAVTGVDPSAATDADVGILSVSITFDEPMDTGTNPSSTITGLTTDPYTITGSAWSNGDQTWTGNFTFVDENEKATGVYNIAGFTDPAGNTMVANNSKSIEVDTDNPTAVVTVSDLLITDVDAGGVFTVTVVYSEGMVTNGSADPTLVFSPDVVGGDSPTLVNASGGWGGTNDTYTVTFDVADNGIDANSATIDVTGAQDSNGNPQQNYTPVHEFEVDTLNPSMISVVLSDTFIESIDVGDLFSVTVTFSEVMTTNGSADPTLGFTPAVGTSLSWVGQLWTPTTYAVDYDILDGNIIEIGVDVNVQGAKDEHGNALVAAYDALDRFDIDTLTPVPSEVPDIDIVPLGAAGAGGFLDRCLDLAEGEEAPMIGECALSAIYEVGEFVTGACNICDGAGSAMRGSYIHVYIYAVDIEPRPELLTLLDHWTVHYDQSTGGYTYSWDTQGMAPGYYDIHLGFADGSSHTCRIQLIESVE